MGASGCFLVEEQGPQSVPTPLQAVQTDLGQAWPQGPQGRGKLACGFPLGPLSGS